ncbi:MAG: hypothetical protein JJU46_00175 [Balneolaceae bacterium]|nr:hypothetical protein [Balneolaceae bacterium]MCH8550014.1 hypothetical protein [Balneolaceae bacterium]
MTDKQKERVRKKIAMIRKELAADKKRWGGFHDDSRGLRYMPPELFIKLRDYKGGLRYLRWFDRTFSDDIGYPLFLFEWTLILFKTGNLKEAEVKAYQTFHANSYFLHKFLGIDVEGLFEIKSTHRNSRELADDMIYSKDDPEFAEFRVWLDSLLKSEKFNKFASELTNIDKKLETEPVGEKRSALVNRRSKLIDEV